MAAMSCVEGPFGPGFRFRREEENSRRYFRWTSALWNSNSVAGLRIADSFGNAMWAHKEGSQPEHKAIEHGEIWRTLSGAIADHELMFEQERFSCDLARAARAEEFREGHEQMDRQEEQIAHELKIIMPANKGTACPWQSKHVWQGSARPLVAFIGDLLRGYLQFVDDPLSLTHGRPVAEELPQVLFFPAYSRLGSLAPVHGH